MAAKIRCTEILQEVGLSLRSVLEKLYSTWDEIGIVQEQRRKREEVVIYHMRNLLEEMAKEEEVLKARVLENIEKFGDELLKLCQELNLPPHEPPEGLTLLQLEKNLRTQSDLLALEKHERMKKLKRLRDTDQHLCDILCTTPYYIPSNTVPSKEQLTGLEEHITDLETEKERRHSTFKTMKVEIVKLLEDLEQCPNTSFERDIVCEEDDSFLLSNDNMKGLKNYCETLERQQKENFSAASKLRDRVESLWERLKIPEEDRMSFNTSYTGFKPKTLKALKDEVSRCEVLKLQNMRQVIDGTKQELDHWWQKCFYSNDQKAAFAPYYRQDDYTEESLDKHEKEVQNLKDYYEANQTMLEKVERWQVLWRDFIEFERKASDPNRFFNRGCTLLKEEKSRKKLLKEMPKVEEDVKEQIEQWEQRIKRPFLVNGVRFVDYIEQQRELFNARKENEKTQRHQKKTKEMEEEMMYGSKPTTPAKRRFANTPSKTPNKLRKLENGMKCASSTESIQQSLSSTGSSVASSTTANPASSTLKSRSARANKVGAKLDDTKTPSTTPGRNRTAALRSHHASTFSPVCMPPRSNKASRPPYATDTSDDRKALSEKNGDSEALFSHTTVSSGGGKSCTSGESSNNSEESISVGSIGQYHDFARGLNQNARPNCRSSVMPKPAFF